MQVRITHGRNYMVVQSDHPDQRDRRPTAPITSRRGRLSIVSQQHGRIQMPACLSPRAAFMVLTNACCGD